MFENGWWEDACSSSYPPASAPSHKLQKLSKNSLAYFNHLVPLILFFSKGQSEGGGMAQSHTDTFQTSQNTASQNQRYRSSALKLASSSRTPNWEPLR